MKWIEHIAEHLDLPSREKEQVLEELADHFDQQRDKLLSQGKSIEQADAEAEQILGNPREVAASMQSVHACASWKSAFLAAAPFLLLALILLMNPTWGRYLDATGPNWVYEKAIANMIVGAALVSLTAGIWLLIGSLRQIKHGLEKPLTATWLGIAVFLPILSFLALDARTLLLALKSDYRSVHLLFVGLGVSYPLFALLAAVISARGIKSRGTWLSIFVALAIIVGWFLPSTWGKLHHLKMDNYFLPVIIPCILLMIAMVGGLVFRRSGSSANWSLFTFTLFMSACISFQHSSSNLARATLVGVGVLIAIVTTIAFARCSDWRLKKLTLLPGIIIGSLLYVYGDGGRVGEVQKFLVIVEQFILFAAAMTFGIPAVCGLFRPQKDASSLICK